MTTENRHITIYPQTQSSNDNQSNTHIISLLNKIYNSAMNQHRIHLATQDEEQHQKNIQQYIERFCSNEKCKTCMRISKCINCILSYNNIYPYNFNNMFFYCVQVKDGETTFIVSEQDLSKNLAASILPSPPSKDELCSILYWHVKYHTTFISTYNTPLVPKTSVLRLSCINYLMQQLFDKSQSHSFQYATKSCKQTADRINHELCRLLDYPRGDPVLLLSKLRNYNWNAGRLFAEIMFNLSKGDIENIQKFFYLIANCILGYNFSQTINSDTPKLTVIYCQDIKLMQRFLLDIFNLTLDSPNTSIAKIRNYSNDTMHTRPIPYAFFNFSQWSSFTDTLVHFKDELRGTTIFINTEKASKNTDVISFKKSISNTGSIIRSNDYVFGKIKYKSNSNYIYITDDLDTTKKYLAPLSPYRVIDFSGYVPQEALSAFSVLDRNFVAFAAVYSFINNFSYNVTNSTDIAPKLDATESVKKFIELFCVDSTKNIDTQKMNKLIKEKLPESETESNLSASKYDQLRKDLATSLKITDLEYTRADDLYKGFTEWQQNYPSHIMELTQTNFTDELHHIYSHVFYIKHSKAKSVYKTELSQVKVMYGIKLDPKKVDNYIQNQYGIVDQDQRVLAFETYWKKLIDGCDQWYKLIFPDLCR